MVFGGGGGGGVGGGLKRIPQVIFQGKLYDNFVAFPSHPTMCQVSLSF